MSSAGTVEPRALFARLRRELPGDVLDHIVVVGSRAAAYHYAAQVGRGVKTKDTDLVIHPAGHGLLANMGVTETQLRAIARQVIADAIELVEAAVPHPKISRAEVTLWVMQQRGPPSKNAIWLGEDNWIEQADLTGRYDSAFDIDPELNTLEPMWQALETSCVAGCCGLDAFDFSPENIASAAGHLSVPEVCADIEALRARLDGSDTDVLLSHRLNNFSERRVFDALLGHLLAHFSTIRVDRS